jgi:hypothetical protein
MDKEIKIKIADNYTKVEGNSIGIAESLLGLQAMCEFGKVAIDGLGVPEKFKEPLKELSATTERFTNLLTSDSVGLNLVVIHALSDALSKSILKTMGMNQSARLDIGVQNKSCCEHDPKLARFN